MRVPGRSRHGRRSIHAAVLMVAAPLACFAVLNTSGMTIAAGPTDPPASPSITRPAVPVRIRIDALGVDLPVVSSDREVRGNVPGYPLCDVAQYWTRFDLPGAPGSTWIYAHAQPGMFLPLLEVAEATDGEGLLGALVSLQLEDGRLLTYRIDTVRQHAVSLRLARDRGRREHRLVLQTSEGPPGTVPKLQLAGQLVGATWTDEAAPRPRPRACSSPARPDGRRGSPPPGAGASANVQPSPGAEPIELGPVTLAPVDLSSPDLMSTIIGAAAVLLGSALLAWRVIGRRD